ncbi:hypothetical protein ACA910_004220 [Epithemia clementina (nom. ined.)]
MQSVSLLNAQRKRQRRQAAGALVTGLFAGGNNGYPSQGAASAVAVVSEETNNGSPVPHGSAPGKSLAEKKAAKKKSTAQPRPEIQIPPRGIGPIYEPNCNDVLCGRGGRINAHAGNVRFRDIVVVRKKEYLAPTTKKLEKAHIAADIVRDIRAKDPSGRFLKEDSDGAWYDIGDAKAIKKVGQALREDAPDIRDEIGSDEEKEEGEASPAKDNTSPVAKKAPLVAENAKKLVPAPLPPQPLATVTIGTATAVSGRGAKVITTQSSQRSVSSQHSKGSYSSFQPILPPTQEQGPSKIMFPGVRGRGAKGVSGAAAAAMRHSEDSNPAIHPEDTTQDIAFGRQFHVPENGGDSSMISGMSAGTGANPSAVSGMSGISALTDPISALSAENPEFQQPMARPQTMQQFQAMRINQLQQLRQQWAQSSQRQGSQRTLESADVRSLGSSSLQRSRSWQESQMQHGETMSWTDHSLIGGGIQDVNSVMSGQQSFHSYYLRDQHAGAAMPMGPSAVYGSGVTNGYCDPAVMRQGSSGMFAAAAAARQLVAPQVQQLQQHHPANVPPMPAPAQLYYGSSSGEESSAKTNRMAGGGGGGNFGSGASVASMSIASASISGSIMSDLSENLIALDLAESRLLDRRYEESS